MTRSRFRFLADQFFISKAFASERSRRFYKPISVSSFAGIKSKSLFIQVSEKVKRFYGNVSTFDRPFEQRPKVFNSVSVNMTVHIFIRVIDYMMDIFFAKLIVRAKRITVDGRALLNMLAHFTVKHSPFGSLDNHSANFAVSLKQTHDSNLASVSRAKVSAFAHVHVSSLAANVGFVNFDFAAQFVERSGLHRLADSVQNKPCALLSHAKRARQFAGTNAVLRVGNEPDRSHPSIEADRRIFHDAANLDAKLFLTGFAFPKAAGRKIRDFAAFAVRALNAVRPAKLHQEIRGVFRVSKVDDCLLKGLREFSSFLHGEAMLQEIDW